MVMETQSKFSDEFDLINYLACEKNDSALVDEQLLSWKNWGYDSYSDLPTKIKNLSNSKGNFDLDSLLDEKDRKRIEQILTSSGSLTLKSEALSCKVNLNKTKGFVPKKTIYTYSYPILIKGTNQELYGNILEQETFELNSEIWLKIYVKRSGSWELVYEIQKGFS
jgi:hypothetical protein